MQRNSDRIKIHGPEKRGKLALTATTCIVYPLSSSFGGNAVILSRHRFAGERNCALLSSSFVLLLIRQHFECCISRCRPYIVSLLSHEQSLQSSRIRFIPVLLTCQVCGAYSSQLQLDVGTCISGFNILKVLQESKESMPVKRLFYKAGVYR